MTNSLITKQLYYRKAVAFPYTINEQKNKFTTKNI